MTNLIELYLKLVGLVIVGLILGRILPAKSKSRLGQFLFWVGVPLSIIAFVRKADLSGQIWIAPMFAHIAILLGAFFAWVVIKGKAYLTNTTPKLPTQGSFLLAAMMGNTGYLGYPVTLAVVGTKYFAWALCYDLLGSTLGVYGLGVVLAARFGGGVQNTQQIIRAILINPALWSFGFGLLLQRIAIAPWLEFCLEKLAWSVVALSLVLIGMRLAQLESWRHTLKWASMSLGIKMLLVPLILGSTLPLIGLTGAAAKVIFLQMAMPPAFATLIIAETFALDHNLAVTALAMGVMVLVVILPVWFWLFSFSL